MKESQLEIPSPEDADKEKRVDEILEMRQKLISFLLSQGCDANDVEDRAQETLTRAISKINQFKGDSELKTWVFSIARNLFLDFTRKSYHKREMLAGTIINDPFYSQGKDLTDPNKFHSDSSETRDAVMENEKFSLIKESIDKLDEPFRSMLTDRMEGLSYEDIAHKLNIPLGTVMSRLFYARKYLRKILDAKKINILE